MIEGKKILITGGAGFIGVHCAIGEDFNLGNPVTANTIYDLAQRIIRLSDSKSKLVTTPYTSSDIGVRAPGCRKARELIGYNPTHDLDAGLLPTIEWFRQNREIFSHWLD
jgi:nucleoside-diphosphate-sugar epimerase